MVRKSPRLDCTVPQPLLDRITALVGLTEEGQNDLIRRAIAIGVESIESEITRHNQYKTALISHENALGVQEKLARRGQKWEEAIALLEESGDERSLKAVELLRGSAGG